MIGKLISLPFRLIGGSFGMVGSLLKFVFAVIFGILGLLFKNTLGVIIGVVGGFFIAKKVMQAEECNCDGNCKEDETPVEG